MLITQSSARPSEIRNGVSDLISGNVEAVVVCSAYVSVDGSVLLTQLLRSNAVTSIVDLPKTVLTCFDYGITAPEALEYWLVQPNTTVLVSGA